MDNKFCEVNTKFNTIRYASNVAELCKYFANLMVYTDLLDNIDSVRELKDSESAKAEIESILLKSIST